MFSFRNSIFLYFHIAILRYIILKTKIFLHKFEKEIQNMSIQENYHKIKAQIPEKL